MNGTYMGLMFKRKIFFMLNLAVLFTIHAATNYRTVSPIPKTASEISTPSDVSSEKSTESTEELFPAEKVESKKQKHWSIWPQLQRNKKNKIIPAVRIPNVARIVENLDKKGIISQLIVYAKIPNITLSDPLPFLKNRALKSGLLSEASKENVKVRLTTSITRCIQNAVQLFSSTQHELKTLEALCINSSLRQEEQELANIKANLLELQENDRRKFRAQSKVHPNPGNY